MVQANASSANEPASHPAIARTGHSIRDGVSHTNVMTPSAVEMRSRPDGRRGDKSNH